MGVDAGVKLHATEAAIQPSFTSSLFCLCLFLLLLGPKLFLSRENRGWGFRRKRRLAGDTPPSDVPAFRQKVGAAVSQRACGANVSHSGVIVSGGLEEPGGRLEAAGVLQGQIPAV